MNTVSLTSEFDLKDNIVPEWVKILPLGEFSAVDGRHLIVEDPETIVKNSIRENVDIPFDYEHATESNDTNPKPAAGWIKALEVREDGIWAKVEWTEKAFGLIKNKEYRYLSPVLAHTLNENKSLVINSVNSVALTNTPALQMKAFFKNDQVTSLKNEQALKEIACMINTKSSDPTEILAALKKQQQEQEISLCKKDVQEAMTTFVFPLSCEDDFLSIRQTLGQDRFKTLAQKLSCSGFGYLQMATTQTAALKARGINHDKKANTYGLSEQELAVCKETNIKPESYLKFKELNNEC